MPEPGRGGRDAPTHRHPYRVCLPWPHAGLASARLPFATSHGWRLKVASLLPLTAPKSKRYAAARLQTKHSTRFFARYLFGAAFDARNSRKCCHFPGRDIFIPLRGGFSTLYWWNPFGPGGSLVVWLISAMAGSYFDLGFGFG